MSERIIELVTDSFFNILIPGLTATIPLTVISFAFALVIAIAVALIQFADVKVLKEITRFYVWVIRGTPLLVQLFVVFYGLPSIGILLDPFPAAVIVFSINEGAYCAETIRAGLEAVPSGQMEAGECIGMSYIMIKDTSLAANITVTEMFMATQRIVARTYEPLILYIEVGVIYLVFCTVFTRIERWGEKKLGRYRI